MNTKSLSLALVLCAGGPAMAMAVSPSATGLTGIADSIATFQAKSKAFVSPDAAEPAKSSEARGGSNDAARPEVLIVESIPEPETWALMAVGLGIIGLAARRRNSMDR